MYNASNTLRPPTMRPQFVTLNLTKLPIPYGPAPGPIKKSFVVRAAMFAAWRRAGYEVLYTWQD